MAFVIAFLALPASGLLVPAPRLLANSVCTLDVCDGVSPLAPPDNEASAVYWLKVSPDAGLSAKVGDKVGTPPPSCDRGGGDGETLVRCLLHSSPTSAESPPPIAREPVGTRLLWSDESVNIWEFRLAQGASCPYHHHYLPYTFINLVSSLTQAIDAGGAEVGEPNLQLEGQVVYVDEAALGKHGVKNVGDGEFLQFILEFKYPLASRASSAKGALDDAEKRVQALFTRVKEASPEEADAVVEELKAAQEALAEARCDEQRRQCELMLSSEAVGGEAAALALESLVAAGVAPDAGCYRSALRACAATEDSAQGDADLTGDWTLMLWEDACSSGMMDSEGAAHALRACVRSSSWLAAREVLRTAQSHELIISPHVLESVMLCCASSSEADDLAREAATAVLAQDPDYVWDGALEYPRMKLCGAPSASAVMALLASSFRRLVVAQFEAGPSRTVVRDEPFELTILEPSLDEDWHEAIAARHAPPTTSLGGEQAASRLAVKLAPLLSSFLGGGVQVPVSARPRSDGGAVIAIDRAGVEDWIRGECVKTWYGEHTELAERIRAAQMAAHEEERAREAALEEASRAAASLRAKRIDKLTRRNERIIQEAEREQLNKRTSMAVALDNAAVDAAAKMGIEDVDVPVEWGRGESDDAGKVLSNPTLDEPGAGEENSSSPASTTQPDERRGGEDDVTCLPGIGPKRAEALRSAGLGTVGALALLSSSADIERVANEHRLPKPSLGRWVAAAREHVAAPPL